MTPAYWEQAWRHQQSQDQYYGLVVQLEHAILDLVIGDVVAQLGADHGELRRVRQRICSRVAQKQ